MTLAFAPHEVLQLDPRIELALSLSEVHEIPPSEITDPAEAMFWAYKEAMADGLGGLALLDADIETPHSPMFFGTQWYSPSEITVRRNDIARKKRMPWLNIVAGVDPWFEQKYSR